MDALNRKLEELKLQVWVLLPEIDDPRLIHLLSKIDHLEKTKEILGVEMEAAGVYRASVEPESRPIPTRALALDGMTRGSAMVEILRKSPSGMHVNHIVEDLKANYSFDVSRRSAIGIMKGDTQERFKSLGRGYYAISDVYLQKIRTNGNGYVPRPAFKRIKGLDITLRQAVLNVIRGIEGEFSQPDVYDLLIKTFPKAKDSILKETVSVTLNNMKKSKLLDESFAGRGRYPKLYFKTPALEALFKSSSDTALQDYHRVLSQTKRSAANDNELAKVS